jgi:magnesium transporter
VRERILGYIKARDMEGLKALLFGAEDMEILFAFNDLTDEEQVIVFRLLSKDAALGLFEQLDTNHQQTLLRSFTDEKTVEFINEMAPDDRVRLLDELPAGVAKKMINQLSPGERAVTNALMGYAPETAGRIMTTEFISLNRQMTARQALMKVRRQGREMETVYNLFITDNQKKLEGVMSLKDLIMAEPDLPVEDIMVKKSISVYTDTDQEEVAKTLQELDLLAIPVVDKERRLVGIVTIDDAVDVLQDEATEDIFMLAGIRDVAETEADRSEVLLNGSTLTIWRVRMPFLIITLVAGFLAGFIIHGFEEALESIAVVAIFIPVIMGMGGNVGMQSSTVFARGVVLGHIQMKRFLRHLMKETFIGLTIGLIIGSVAGCVAVVWLGDPMLGLAVGLSMAVSMTLVAFLGFLVPFLLIKIKADQAAGAAPIITSIMDIAGLVIYFVFVLIFMGKMM